MEKHHCQYFSQHPRGTLADISIQVEPRGAYRCFGVYGITGEENPQCLQQQLYQPHGTDKIGLGINLGKTNLV